MSEASALDTALLAAHASGDAGQLIHLYRRAGETALAQGETDRGCFFLTHAYIFALEAGAPDAQKLRETLIAFGREE